jgi:hypothetical protein
MVPQLQNAGPTRTVGPVEWSRGTVTVPQVQNAAARRCLALFQYCLKLFDTVHTRGTVGSRAVPC